MHSYVSYSWVFPSLLIIVPITLLTVGLLWVVRKNVSDKTLRKHHDVAGYLFSIIGVLYSVILGFTVINVNERFNKADETVSTEATIMTDLYRDAVYFDQASLTSIRTNIRKYVDYVIHEEWGFPGDQIRRMHADDILQDLWKSYEDVDLQNEKAKIWYQQTIEKLDLLMNARLAREFYSWQNLSSMMWTILIVGAIITTCFMFFFGLENIRLQMLMTSLLTIYLTFMLYLVYTLDHVFEGPVQVTPRAFEESVSVFDRLDKQDLL